MKKLIAQFMKFGIVGVIAFLIDYGLMVAVRKRLVHRLPYREDHRDSFGGYLEFCHAKDLLREALTQKH